MVFALVASLLFVVLVAPIDVRWPLLEVPALLGAMTLADAGEFMGML